MSLKYKKLKPAFVIAIILIANPAFLSSQKLIARTNKIQTIYQNINNPLLTNLQCVDDKLELASENGIIISRDHQIYWRPEKLGKTYLKLVSHRSPNLIVVDSVEFFVKSYNQPKIQFNRKRMHSGVADFNRSTKFVFHFDEEVKHLALEEKIEIKSFEMHVTIDPPDGQIDSFLFLSKSNSIPQEFNEIKRNLKVGDNLSIELKKVEIECDWICEDKYFDDESYYRFMDVFPENRLKWVFTIK